MVLSCLGLLYMQMDYINAIGRMRREHFDETVKDVVAQYRRNITTMPAFVIYLLPEGDPVVDKAEYYAENTIIYTNRQPRYSAYYRCIIAWFFVGDVSNFVCIGVCIIHSPRGHIHSPCFS